MQHYWSIEEVNLKSSWLTIGAFDGVHRGHQAIIRELSAGAQAVGVPAVVLCFYPSPAKVLREIQGPYYLTTPEERADLLGQMGVDIVITHPFNRQLANISAHEFVSLLAKHLRMSYLCVGHDFALGRGREGNLSMLARLGEELGFSLNVMDPIRQSEEIVSSSLIRSALLEGDLTRAERMLGRAYTVCGKVVHGDARGRTIGIPTANLEVGPERLLPKVGVYACRVQVGELHLPAVTNVGIRPTFENQPPEPRVETHLLDFNKDLYDQQICISFIARLRDEKRFSGIQSLVEQIKLDIQAARNIL